MSKPLPRLLWAILLIGLVLRVGWAMVQPNSDQTIDRLPDQREYLSLAQNLLGHGSLYFVDPRFNQAVYAYRMPGYPLFLAICHGSVRIARLAQCLIDVSTLLAVFLIGRRLSDSPRVGLFAAGLMAVNPFYIYFCGLILTETLFAASIIWAIWSLVNRRWLMATAFLVTATCLRPTGLPFLPVLVMVGSLNPQTPLSYRLWDALRRCTIATFIVLMCLYPWARRNDQRLGQWIWTTTNAGITLYDGFNPAATGASDQRFVTQLPLVKTINEVDRSRFFEARARDWIGRNWQTIPLLSARKLLRGWSPVPLSQDFGRTAYRWISAAYTVPFDLLCLVGLFSPALSRRAKVLIVMPALIVTLAQVMSVGSIRYTMPAEAPLAVLAAVAMMDVLQRKSRRLR